MKKETSEFGRGFVYNLILFAKHYEKHIKWVGEYKKIREEKEKLPKEVRTCAGKSIKIFTDENALSLAFNGSSDHFYELEIPKQWQGKKIGKLAKWLQDRCLYFGHGFKKKTNYERL